MSDTEQECAGCGAKGQAAQVGPDVEPTALGYACGCLQAFSDKLNAGGRFFDARRWAKARRAGRAA